MVSTQMFHTSGEMPFCLKADSFFLSCSYHTQVCSGRCIQVSTETRVGGQKLSLLGVVQMQQLMGVTSQQQGDARGALATPAASGNTVGLRLRIPVFLRRCGLAALVHVRHRLCSAGLSCV